MENIDQNCKNTDTSAFFGKTIPRYLDDSQKNPDPVKKPSAGNTVHRRYSELGPMLLQKRKRYIRLT